jgi:hypothetical protein
MYGEHLPAKQADQDAVIADWLAEARITGTEDAYRGKRRWPRVTWQVPVTLEVHPGERRSRTCHATSRDISEGGLGLRLRQRLPAMAPVRVFIGEDERSVRGRVVHCTDTLGGFIVGVEFVSEPVTVAAASLRKTA